MLFNTFPYLLFSPIVFILYWLVDYLLSKVERTKSKDYTIIRNSLLVLASYVFYAWWDWRFLGLLIGMSLISYFAGVLLANDKIGGGITHSRKIILWSTVSIDLLTLGLFKYYNFFVESFCSLFSLNSNLSTLNLILPLGISFFTFQAISYVVDCYQGKLPLKCTMHDAQCTIKIENLINCLLYIGFFPKLLAGPIERPSHLLPQIQQKRVFDYDMAVDGCRQILWGLFKKVVVADNCAIFVNLVWDNYTNECGSTLALAAILYTIQIYGDFSGYSDMAIGSAKLLGFKFRDNFLFPYFSRNMGEFWKRWHISLNTWFVDYVYIPLGGSRNGKARTIANTMIIFLLSGLWHGADWSFVAWGGYHGLLLVILILCGWNTKYEHVVAYDRHLPSLKEFGQMLLVFILATIGWILFRAPSIADAWGYIGGMCQFGTFHCIHRFFTQANLSPSNWLIIGMFLMEWLIRHKKHGLDICSIKHSWLRIIIYYVFIILIWRYSSGEQTFIYLQF